jgi:UDP-N-acetylmuramoyl-tripeptide--D-alanyl-D-alanine ligase
MAVEKIRAAVRGLLVCGDREREISSVTTDSRSVRSGDLFIALAGENFDGHNYIRDAVNAGAAGAIYSKDSPLYKEDASRVFIKVADTLTALGDLARAYRGELGATVIGVTGSNGKTTTKEMTRHLLSGRLAVVASPASFNNFIGVPLTLFEADAATRVAVIEMGTNAPGEISRLAEIAEPDVAVVTNVGRTHLEGLSSIEGVARAKAELVAALDREGFAILNADDELVARMGKVSDAQVVTFGIERPADVFADNIERTESGFSFRINGAVDAVLSVPGRHNIYNALAAIAVCRRLGLELPYLAEKLSGFTLPKMRLEERTIGGVLFVNDAYNANPESTAGAIEELAERKGTRRILVFADMLELGEHSARLHGEVGQKAAAAGLDCLWATGDDARHAVAAAREGGMGDENACFFDSLEALARHLGGMMEEGDVVLVKGSRGRRLERLFDLLESPLRRARRET